ncbi:MAG: VWA domain-containing protein [Acidobacteria bacterium]|nr:VWA domain-containing protein [Acidobacteriota bacterium]MCA1637624.1 VWA domain-containing protein [Acidobacteriota bacterium]
MKRILIVLVCLNFFGISAFAQSGRTSRPRVVTAPTTSTTQTDSSNQNSNKRPPVLIGDKKSTGQTNTSTNPSDDLGEVDDEIIRVETNLVTIPVSVLDRDGRFISGLLKKDFQIFENGVEQQIDSFASVEQPFTVILLLDVSPSTQYQINEIQDAAIAFVDQLRRDDKVMVIAFDQKVQILSPATNNRAVLRNAILRADFGEGTSLYDTVDYVIRQQLRQIEGRKAVVLFTDGVDTTSRRANYQTTVKEAEEVDALFYPIRYDTYDSMAGNSGGTSYPSSRRRSGNVGIGDLIGIILGGNVQMGGGGGVAGSSRAEYEMGRRYLEDLARNSGGRTFEGSTISNLDAAFSGIAEELRRQYSLRYYPEAVGQKGERRQIRVRVKRPNLVVRAKNSYIVGQNESKVAGK